MKYFFTVLSVLIILACKAQEQQQTQEQKQMQETEKDFAAVERVVYDFFASINSLNYQSLRDHVNDDFSLFYDGEILDLEGLINLLQGWEAKTTKNYELEIISTKIQGDFAWMAWRNSAGIKLDAASNRLGWLESAVLKKEKGLWKMVFYHSTVAKNTGPSN